MTTAAGNVGGPQRTYDASAYTPMTGGGAGVDHNAQAYMSKPEQKLTTGQTIVKAFTSLLRGIGRLGDYCAVSLGVALGIKGTLAAYAFVIPLLVDLVSCGISIAKGKMPNPPVARLLDTIYFRTKTLKNQRRSIFF